MVQTHQTLREYVTFLEDTMKTQSMKGIKISIVSNDTGFVQG